MTSQLYGEIDAGIYMELPKRMEETLEELAEYESDLVIKKKAKEMTSQIKKGNKVCKLKRAIYDDI